MGMSDPETLKVYAEKAQHYSDLMTESAGKDPLQIRFIAAVANGGHVLDLGCGPGHFAHVMAQAGLHVTASDAVPEMVALIPKHPLITPVQSTFDDIAGTDIYDGIWANFSLLHAPRDDMPRHLKALHTALKPGGLFHIALKTGDNTKRDSLGRQYTYYTQNTLTDVVTAAGFTVDTCTKGRDVGLDGMPADWIALHAHG
jgi:2-polyprenyl-3-methyl-5-hydroxy-6-metoxy-1,4-benzoquinol methylase